jgi:hypothetical protein
MDSEIQQLVDDLAARLNRSVSAGDASFVTFAFSAQPAGFDRARIVSILERRTSADVVAWARRHRLHEAHAPVRVPGHAKAHLKDRIWAPLRAEGALLGYMSIIDEGHRLPDSVLPEIAAVADRIAELLHLEHRGLEAVTKRERRSLVGLLGDNPDDRRRAVADLTDVAGVLAQRCVVIAAVVPATFPVHDAITVPRPAGSPSSTRLHHFRQAWVLVADADRDEADVAARGLALRVLETLRRITPEEELGAVGVGVGDRVPLEEAVQSHRRALDAIRVARAYREFWPLALWDELGSYRIFAAATRDPSAAQLDPMLVRLLEADRTGDLLTTLEAYFDCAGDAQATTRELHLHRTSLYYRLNRIEEITGASLRDGDDRLRLHLAVKMARLTDAVGDAGRVEGAAPRRTSQ